MKKSLATILCILLLSMKNLGIYAQQKTVIIDNQMPGWLSSKISYGDQQTIEELKISGYLNGTDFKFLVDLHENQKLKILDLADANIVHGGESLSLGIINTTSYRPITIEDNYIDSDLFLLFPRMQKIITPKSVSKTETLFFDCDSVIINGTLNQIAIYPQNGKKYINYLELSEGIDSVSLIGIDPIYPTLSISWTKMQKLVLPSTITKIANLYLTTKSKGNIVSRIEHPELVEYINCSIEGGDTIFVPIGTKERYQSKQSKFNVFKNIVELAPPTSINLNQHFVKIYKDESISFSASLIPKDAYYKELVWKSTDEKVITVSSTGKVVATGFGTASIIVCSEKDERIADTCEVKVFEHSTGISISHNQAEVNIGETIELQANTLPLMTSDNEIVWNTSNAEIASVNSNGKVTALKLGVCTITATAVDGGASAECVVTVIQPAKGININKHTLTLNVGNNEELQATVSPDNTTYKEVNWSSSNIDVAEVSNRGVVTAKKAGKVYVKAISVPNPQIKDSCEVIVLQPVTGIELDETSIIFDMVGKTAQLMATVLPDDASNKALRWTSSNPSVCTVSESGIVVAMGVGNAIITATSVDGGFVATCMVTVLQPVTSINLNKHTMKIRVGSYEELHVTVSPDNASDKSVSWSSSDHNVIDVDDKGMVTARNAGKAFVIVKSKANDILKDSCEVIVLQPVTGVIISEPTITFGSIGSTKQLSATVLPNNASDKSVRWESSNVSICMVSDNGLVVAVGTGTAVVSVTTIDGGYIAVCVVTVTESDGIMTMEVDDLTGNEQIYDIQGKRIQSLQKGINIIRMNDGTIKKVIVK